MDKVRAVFFLVGVLSAQGCATVQPASEKAESVRDQMQAAQKVVEALAPAGSVAEKYSPVTGRHYSGALEYEPGTGVKLIPVEE